MTDKRVEGGGFVGAAIALVAPLVATALAVVWPAPYPYPFLPLVAGVVVSSRLGGLRAGMSATAASALAGWFLILRPVPVEQVDQATQVLFVTAFVALGAAISLGHEGLRLREQRFRDLFEHASDGVFVTGLRGDCTNVNHAACELVGFSRDELLQKNIGDLIPQNDVARFAETIARLTSGGTHVAEWLLQRRDGALVDVEISAKRLPGRRLQAFVRDITSRRRAEEQLRQAAIVVENTSEAVMVSDASKRLISVNHAFTAITGFDADEVVGQTLRFLRSARHTDEFDAQLWAAVVSQGFWRGEISNRRKNGQIYPAWENVSAVRDEEGRVTHYVAMHSDISSIKLAEERLTFLAHHDGLTGLPNRLLFVESLDTALHRARRRKGSVALLFLDLDRFKLVNDTMGHAAGDRLLQEVAGRLKATLRSEDLLARLGGDEFVVAVEAFTRTDDFVHVAEKVLAGIRQPLVLDGREVVTSSSLGIAIYPDDGSSSQELMKAADAAMYRAKELGRDRFTFYSPEMTAQALERFSVEQGLRRALVRGEFELYYQPQFDLSSQRLLGLEALLRWNHPEEGLLPPDRFITIAEDHGLMPELGAWVIREALRQARQWVDDGRRPPCLAINVSGHQIAHGTLLDALESARSENRLALDDVTVELEITESALLRSMEQSAQVLGALRARGVRVAIDDFGTGYSTFSVLEHLPIDTLKIDRGFVHNIPDDRFSKAIASALITMSRSLGLRVIAEGVETDEQAAFLRDLGCEQAQGFLFGPAMPAAAIGGLLQKAVAGGAGHGREASVA
jgi:diguanylate cyclase (GGDEF)-like protein/PAS domain S-box-containing protein